MKRTVRLLSLLIAALLVLTACSSAEEAGQETESEPGAPAITSEPAVVESEPAAETPSEPSLDATETAPDTGDTSTGSIFDMAEENPQLSQLVTAIEAAGLRDELEQAGPVTLFAPNNEAFGALGQDDLTGLLADPQSLSDIIQFHVVEGTYPSSELSDGQTLTTMEGSDLTVSVDGGTISVNGAEVVQPDLEAGDSVIHIIDGVLQP
jgi:uncharacterized surface protein with fasciclin (FAS1) repeats